MKQPHARKNMEAAGSLTPDLEGAPRSMSHNRRQVVRFAEKKRPQGRKKA